MNSNHRIDYVDIDGELVKRGAKSLESIFRSSGSIRTTAYLNWRTKGATSREQFVVLGRAYFLSAYSLLCECLENNIDKTADILIFPILFDTVHGIEVYLKGIRASLNCLLGDKQKITEGKHQIQQICQKVRCLVRDYRSINRCSTTDQMMEAIEYVLNFVNNIYEKTRDMSFARYPMSIDEESHFYIDAVENEAIDMELFREQLVIVYHMLDFLFEMPELDIDVKAEEMMKLYNS